MARLADCHPANTPGEWYVDTRCIDCDASRHYAPQLITALGDGQSVVTHQPDTPETETLMWRAALACPTRSIGTRSRRAAPAGIFPLEVAPGVLLCGHNDRRSFGAHSWFVPPSGGSGVAAGAAARGGFLVDSPHFERGLVEAFGRAGGIEHVLLTHRDDVADAGRYAAHFGARVWIHETERDAAPFATDVIRGSEEVPIAPGLVAFPAPGHTRGSVLYLHDERHLFSGDTLAWFWREGDLGAFRGATWYSWDALRDSLRRFVDSGHRFEWVCPGHGKWHGATAEEMHARLTALVARM